MMRFGRFLVLTCLLCASCHSGQSEKSSAREVDMKAASVELLIPPILWGAIEKAYGALVAAPAAAPAEGEKEEKAEGEKKAKKKVSEEEFIVKHHPVLQLVPLTVGLKEKTQGILSGGDILLKFPAGGGSLNYQRFLNEKKSGTFYLNVTFDPAFNMKLFRVFYLSDSVSRDQSRKIWGNGCNRFYDLTHYFRESLAHEGLILNTVKARHVSVSAGTYFFVSAQDTKLQISQLIITDSGHRELLCQKEKL